MPLSSGNTEEQLSQRNHMLLNVLFAEKKYAKKINNDSYITYLLCLCRRALCHEV